MEKEAPFDGLLVSRMSGQVPKLGLKYWKLRAQKLTLHLINVAEINAQQNEHDLN